MSFGMGRVVGGQGSVVDCISRETCPGNMPVLKSRQTPKSTNGKKQKWRKRKIEELGSDCTLGLLGILGP
jgi:hypothetical protein